MHCYAPIRMQARSVSPRVWTVAACPLVLGLHSHACGFSPRRWWGSVMACASVYAAGPLGTAPTRSCAEHISSLLQQADKLRCTPGQRGEQSTEPALQLELDVRCRKSLKWPALQMYRDSDMGKEVDCFSK